jgi:hypothetical protein
MARESHWRNMPHNFSRREVLDTVGEDGMRKWRNPFRIPEVHNGWPTPKDTRAKDYEKILSTDTEMSRKGRPI